MARQKTAPPPAAAAAVAVGRCRWRRGAEASCGRPPGPPPAPLPAAHHSRPQRKVPGQHLLPIQRCHRRLPQKTRLPRGRPKTGLLMPRAPLCAPQAGAAAAAAADAAPASSRWAAAARFRARAPLRSACRQGAPALQASLCGPCSTRGFRPCTRAGHAAPALCNHLVDRELCSGGQPGRSHIEWSPAQLQHRHSIDTHAWELYSLVSSRKIDILQADGCRGTRRPPAAAHRHRRIARRLACMLA